MTGRIQTKADLLAAKERTYDEFVAAVAAIGDTRTGNESRPVGEDWGPRDMVAHVAYWDASLAKALLAWLLEGTPFPGFDSYDEINAFSITLRRAHPLKRVLAELEAAHCDVMAIVQEFFTDETLERSILVAYPSRVEQEPISDLLTAYVEHYVEHAAQIRAWRAA